MILTEAVPFSEEREIGRLASLACMLSKSVSNQDSVVIAGMLCEALKWGRFDAAAADWRFLRDQLELLAKERNGTLESLAMSALSRAVLAFPQLGEEPHRSYLEQIMDIEAMVLLISTQKQWLPKLTKGGDILGSLELMVEKLTEIAQAATSERDQFGLKWVIAWTSRVHRSVQEVQELNAGANSVGMLLDALLPDEPIPIQLLEVRGVAALLTSTRNSIVQWLKTEKKVEVISPIPLIDRMSGEAHDVTYVQSAGVSDGIVTRLLHMGWRSGGQITRRAEVWVARTSPSPERSDSGVIALKADGADGTDKTRARTP